MYSGVVFLSYPSALLLGMDAAALLTWDGKSCWSRSPTLVRSPARQHHPRSLEKDLNIQPQGPLVNVSQVQTHHIIEGSGAPSLHLPKSGDPRLRFYEPASMPDIVRSQFIGNGRPGANQRHVAFQHIYELREFIQACFPEKCTDRSNPGVVRELVNGR